MDNEFNYLIAKYKRSVRTAAQAHEFIRFAPREKALGVLEVAETLGVDEALSLGYDVDRASFLLDELNRAEKDRAFFQREAAEAWRELNRQRSVRW